MNLFNTLFAVILSYAFACGTQGKLLSMYELFNDEKLLMKTVISLLIMLIVMFSIQQWQKQRQYIRTAMTMRRAPGLRKHMIEGVQGGSFAYLAKQVQYGTEGEGSWLPPMAEVYVICDMEEVEPNRIDLERMMLVVPVFKDVSLEQPCMAVQVPRSDLFKHIPRNMIPELL